MPNLTFKQRIIGVIVALGLILIALFNRGLYSSTPSPSPYQETKVSADENYLISTNPKDLKEKKEVIVFPNQTIEFTFNDTIENAGEFKNSIEPKVDYEVNLSMDRKTAKITPKTGFKLGETYTLKIKSETKFDNKKRLNGDLEYKFTTISYNGV